MVPGKKYAPEDYLAVLWRRKWIILVPLVLASVGAFLYSRTLPNRYQSEALVLVIPQQIPENYIRPTVQKPLDERIDLMRQQILSRARLERIIEEFDLYREERRVMLLDQIVERMRNQDIGVSIQRVGKKQDPNHFYVSYESENPQVAMLVAERLASLFVRENLEGRNVQSDTTTQFLQSQVDDALRQLQEHDRRLEAFKRANSGRLPNEVEANIQLMQNARQQIQTLTEDIAADRERQIAVERMLSEEKSIGVTAAPRENRGRGDGDPVPQSAAQQLAGARAALDGLLLRYKEDHPDVRILRSRIRDLEQKAEAEALQQPVSSDSPLAGLTPAEADRQRRISKLQGELQAIDREIAFKQKSIQAAQASLQTQERRVQAAPGLESQLADLMRDAGILQGTYEGLLKKLQDAKLASSLEQRQVSQQFKIIDPARRPERPRSPDRLRINLMGALAGLGFGLLIAGLLEYRDTSLRTEEDVLVALALPVLALVPTMQTSQDVRRRRRMVLVLGSSAAIMFVVSLVAAAWKLRLFEQWGR